MSEVRRVACTQMEIEECDDGPFVLYDDYAALADALRRVEGERNRLAGEVAVHRRIAQEGHPSPCTLGALCPYCEVERLRTRLAAVVEMLQNISDDCVDLIRASEGGERRAWAAIKAAVDRARLAAVEGERNQAVLSGDTGWECAKAWETKHDTLRAEVAQLRVERDRWQRHYNSAVEGRADFRRLYITARERLTALERVAAALQRWRKGDIRDLAGCAAMAREVDDALAALAPRRTGEERS